MRFLLGFTILFLLSGHACSRPTFHISRVQQAWDEASMEELETITRTQNAVNDGGDTEQGGGGGGGGGQQGNGAPQPSPSGGFTVEADTGTSDNFTVAAVPSSDAQEEGEDNSTAAEANAFSLGPTVADGGNGTTASAPLSWDPQENSTAPEASQGDNSTEASPETTAGAQNVTQQADPADGSQNNGTSPGAPSGADGTNSSNPTPSPWVEQDPNEGNSSSNSNSTTLMQNTAAAAPKRGDGFWSVKGMDYVDANGLPVRFSGVIWHGLETADKSLGGLKTRTMDSHLDQMVKLGFNMIRIPFAGQTLDKWVFPEWGLTGANKDLWPLNSMGQMDVLVQKAGARGMKVILCYHRMRLTWENELGTWWDKDLPESVWLSNWKTVAERYKGNPTIIGVDLFNEVHSNDGGDTFPGAFPDGAPYWAETSPNEAYNFRRACVAAINVIHKIEPNWIIFLQGMWQGPYWWGGNLAKVMEAPITEPAGKIALTAHDYGPKVAKLPWFYDEKFPENMPEIYRKYWGFVVEDKIGPLCIGEFGSFMPPPTTDFDERERLAFLALVNYMRSVNASWTIAFWGPDSKDTGGILLDDWQTVNQEKMAALQQIMYPNFEP